MGCAGAPFGVRLFFYRSMSDSKEFYRSSRPQTQFALRLLLGE
jgi:hypothetical protein